MVDVFPGTFRKVHQAISAADGNKGAKICQAGDAANFNIAFSEVFHHFVADHVAGFITRSAFRKDQAMAFSVDFDDVHFDGLANHLFVLRFRGFTADAQPTAHAQL